MMTVSEICTTIGRKELERALGVSKAAISNAVSNEAFPPSWFDVIEAECAKRDINCDRSLFAFRRAPHAPEDAA
ncbi:hypothetical protein [Roseovarius sp. MMSF_3281]|uniref:hypothetical protein n=1 Tax=Roseovarius sp. MMSF_3281 TaxID=3046694 RepID=UPI00273FCD14|nr:hypothetical protein [Roseovarius sp. MMSF_3281]